MYIKNKPNIIHILLCFLLIFSFHCQAEAQKVKTIDGVKVILNGKKPKPAKDVPTKIRLEEDLIVGTGDDPDESFSEVTSFIVDDEGNIYALDLKDRKIKAFDKAGKFLRLVGKKGQGPGEIVNTEHLTVGPMDDIIVTDPFRKLITYDRDGNFKKEVAYIGFIAGFCNLFFLVVILVEVPFPVYFVEYVAVYGAEIWVTLVVINVFKNEV